MSFKTRIGALLSSCNPLAMARRKKMRSQVVNTTASFLCPNCIGGILFHDLGLQFRSPTVNLMMLQTDFVKLVLSLDAYLNKEFEPFTSEQYSCPCGHLGDLDIHFTHYKSFEEATSKWQQRAKRIDPNNLFVFLMERDGLTYEQIKSLSSLHVRGLVVFTAHSYPDIPYALHIPKYEAAGEVGNVLQKSGLDEHREYETYFDFVKWFNEAQDPTYSIAPFVKK